MGFINDLFGGGGSSSTQTSDSKNLAYPWLQQNFGAGGASAFNGGLGQLQGMLGLGGGDPQAFQKYLNSSGYNFMLDSGSRAITGNAAAKGLLNSGSTLKALDTFGQNLASTKMDNYLSHLTDLSKIGLGAGSLIGSAGEVSHSEGQSQGQGAGGLGSFLGSALSIIPFL